MLRQAADVEAIIEKDGERKVHIYNGYRPYFELMKGQFTSGQLSFDQECIKENESAIARVKFIFPEGYPNCLWIGRKVPISEGKIAVGYATIIKIYNEVLDCNSKKVAILDGRDFSDLYGFYGEVQKHLTKNFDRTIGNNLDDLNDILRGGFHEYDEPIRVLWLYSDKSKQDLGEDIFNRIVQVFEENETKEMKLILRGELFE